MNISCVIIFQACRSKNFDIVFFRISKKYVHQISDEIRPEHFHDMLFIRSGRIPKMIVFFNSSDSKYWRRKN